jgi:prophage regulatory protein
MTSFSAASITANLLNKKTLSARLGLSSRTLENMVAADNFPAGVRIGKFVYWSEAVVNNWLSGLFGVQEAWRP